MINLEDFKEHPILEPIILKFNKLYNKNKLEKIPKIIDEFTNLLDNEKLIVPITYILSIAAEKEIILISERTLKKIEQFMDSDNDKLKTNAILIIGFKMLSNSEYIKDYLSIFVNLIKDDSTDIRDNGHFFLGELIKKNPNELCVHKDIILNAFKIEKNDDNISSLLSLISSCKDLSFRQLYKLREILRDLIINNPREKNELIFSSVINLINIFFPSLKEIEKKNLEKEKLTELLEKHFLMKAHNFTSISKKQGISIDDFTKNIKKNYIKDIEFYFYTKNRKSNTIIFFELEYDKLIAFFGREEKISFEEISHKFSSIIENKSDMKLFIEVLVKLGKIDGYYSKLGFFYPYLYLKSTIKTDLKNNGIVNLKNYDFLPPKYIEKIIDQLSVETNQIFLLGKNEKVYYSLKKIQVQVNSEAAKNSSIDLNPFRNRLKDEEFITLIKNLPKEYLTNLRKGTHWLTNIGKTKIRSEIENSKIIGFFNLTRISEKLNVKKILLMDVLEQNIDLRSGIWNMSKEMFYYSKFLKQKIEIINQISEEEEKTIKINALANELNIDKNIILTKIDENLLLIGNEIKKQDQIIISDYLEKLGMDTEMFMNFIHDLGLNYFIKGNTLILNSAKIEDAKKEIRTMLIDKSKSVDFINFGNFDINSELVHSLIKELESDEKIKGIFYEEESEIVFYTENGIKNLMLDSSLLFSFNDFFYGKDLNDKEITLMKKIFNELINSRKLKGLFDEKTLTFSSEEILFAKDYNAIVDDFSKMVNVYVTRFDKEFQIIKKTLSKHDEIIYPQEIKVIQEIIDRININYIKWRAQIKSFIRSTNNKILKEQGFSQKRYEGLPENKKGEIKLFKEDPDVYEVVERFNSWVEFFNELELNYGKIIFLQKKRINNPDDTESEDRLDELLRKLSIIK